MMCPLCLDEKELKNSHIVPEFLYKPAYDEKHRLIQVRSDDPKVRLAQKGIREPLLCALCEALLNDRYERPTSKIWNNIIPASVPKGHDWLQISGVDYATFKLFHLSILWRASVAKGPAWKPVSLGPKHHETIRKMLLESDPSDPLRFPFLANAMLSPTTTELALGTVMAPTSGKFNASRVYMFVYGGCSWHFIVSSHLALPPNPYILDRSGSILLGIRDLRTNKAFDKHMRAHFASARPSAGAARLTRRCS